MFQWAKDWVVGTVSGYAKTAIQAGGTMAGNTVGGVGSMIENTGKGFGDTASGSIGGVGNYVNSYGESIINATAASGPKSSAEKKTAVKPTQAVGKTAGAAKSLPSTAQKSLPAAPAKTPSPAQRTPPSKPPPAKAPPAKKPNSTPQPVSSTNNRPKISASAADKTADGKTRISAASRPNRPAGGAPAKPTGIQKTTQNNSGPRPLPKISAGKEDRTADGKVRMSAASRPRPVKA